MITERAFKAVIVETEQRFDACIATLIGLKAGKASPDLIAFQGTLATALLKCAELDTRLAEEERRVIERKGALTSHWFVRRLKTLAARRAHIRSVSGIGRAIGDSFAWFFYRSDRSLLLEHAQHDRSILSPTGVGGRAEVEFIKGVPLIGAHFVLYHGVTSLLRIGDFSLVRLQPLGVVALGELKAGAKHDQTVPVQAHIFYKKGEVEGLPLDLDRPQGNPERSVVASLRPKAKARFARQAKRMASAVRSASEQVQKELLESRQSSYLPDLRRVIQANPARRFHYSRLGGGLVVAMFRSPRRSLYGYLRGDAAALRRVISVDLSRCVATTVDLSSPYNAIIVSGILFNDDGQPDLILGTVPPFWWGLRSIRSLGRHTPRPSSLPRSMGTPGWSAGAVGANDAGARYPGNDAPLHQDEAEGRGGPRYRHDSARFRTSTG